MLAYLTVRNFALVADLELRFSNGLTVITGESGAGKSILLDALGLVLGQRASKSKIRPDSEACEVCAEFDLSHAPNSLDMLESHGLLDTADPTRCVVRRVATVEGRSRAWVNASPASLNTIRELCGAMVASHGQFSQQQLMGTAVQLSWFDDFVGEETLTTQVRDHFRAWRTLKNTYEEQRQEIEAAHERRELLVFQVAELDDFGLKENEFEELSARFKRLSQTQSILASVNQVLAWLEEAGPSIVGKARNELNRVDDKTSDLDTARELLSTADVSIEEALRSLRSYNEALTLDEGSLDLVSDRLDQLHDLARKHRVGSADLFTKAMALREELNDLDSHQSNLSDLKSEVEATHANYLSTAKRLTKARQAAAKPFSSAVEKTLDQIGMKGARFEVAFFEAETEFGLEKVEFLVSANANYDPGPLRAIASGGELSRISLAILAVVASRSKLPCLVLDEADVGVGGTTADEVGRMLRRLATFSQVVCVTHAPQVAALGDSHLHVLKTDTQDISACELSDSARVEEIARMVGGQRVNAESRAYATVLLKEAQKSEKISSP